MVLEAQGKQRHRLRCPCLRVPNVMTPDAVLEEALNLRPATSLPVKAKSESAPIVVAVSSIFLSHSHADKPFVRRLAEDLRRDGYVVWLDEAEIEVGDSLIEKIREGIDRMAFVGAVLSAASIQSRWVAKELDVAMNKEIEGRRVAVLPILLEDVELPGFLVGKAYADFRDPAKYHGALAKLKRRLDKGTTPTAHGPSSEELRKQLEAARKALAVAESERQLVISRLQIERAKLPERLSQRIEEECRSRPELADINRNFSFEANGFAITANYVLWALSKMDRKGMLTHPIFMLIEDAGKEAELDLLLQAIVRRLDSGSRH